MRIRESIASQFKKKSKFVKVAHGLVSFHKKMRALNFSEIRSRKKSFVSYIEGDHKEGSPMHNNSVQESLHPEEVNNQRRQFLMKMLSENKGTQATKRQDTTISDESHLGSSELKKPQYSPNLT